jgi:hypothetical protein
MQMRETIGSMATSFRDGTAGVKSFTDALSHLEGPTLALLSVLTILGARNTTEAGLGAGLAGAAALAALRLPADQTLLDFRRATGGVSVLPPEEVDRILNPMREGY